MSSFLFLVQMIGAFFGGWFLASAMRSKEAKEKAGVQAKASATKAAKPKLKIVKYSEGRRAIGYVMPGMEFWLGRTSERICPWHKSWGSLPQRLLQGLLGKEFKLYKRLIVFVALVAGLVVLIFLAGLGESHIVRRRRLM